MLTLSLPNAQFDTDPGVYDVKFQDVIEPFETVQVSRARDPATRRHACASLLPAGGCPPYFPSHSFTFRSR
eukprot:scaffold8013_cov124-Isochrysis_galbana.AAC.7